MQLTTGYAGGARSGGVDTEVAAAPVAEAAGVAHAVQAGGSIAVCGAPLRDLPGTSWPPDTGARCPRCVDAVGGFTTR